MAADHTIKARPRTWLRPAALVTLREQSSYGYELMKRLTERGFDEINTGTLYRTLRQMEKEGLCESEWETSNGGSACRMYSVTEVGEAYLAAWAEGCEKYQRILDSFYLAYAGSYSGASKGSEAS